MRLTRQAVPAALALSILALAPAALADVPGPRPQCQVGRLPCESCWQHYGSRPESAASFGSCQEALTAKGLVEACRHRQGAGDTVFFCPRGVKPRIATVGCAAVAPGGGGALPALLAAALALGLRRRR